MDATDRWERLLRVVALAILPAVLVACGGGGGGAQSTDPDAPPAALASLAIVDPAADFRADVEASFTAASDGQPLVIGNAVRTDTTGFAVIDYVDGSVTRLDRTTTFTVEEFAGEVDALEVVTRLDVGRVWNRLDDDSITAFEVRTDVATAAVRGTTFLVSCPTRDECTFVVLEGEVEVTPLGGAPIGLSAGQRVSVTRADDGAGVPSPVASEDAAAGDDPFVVRNDALDDGRPDPGADAAPPPSGADRLLWADMTPEQQRYAGEMCEDAVAAADFEVGTVGGSEEQTLFTIASILLQGLGGPELQPLGVQLDADLEESRVESTAEETGSGVLSLRSVTEEALATVDEINTTCAEIGWPDAP